MAGRPHLSGPIDRATTFHAALRAKASNSSSDRLTRSALSPLVRFEVLFGDAIRKVLAILAIDRVVLTATTAATTHGRSTWFPRAATPGAI